MLGEGAALLPKYKYKAQQRLVMLLNVATHEGQHVPIVHKSSQGLFESTCCWSEVIGVGEYMRVV